MFKITPEIKETFEYLENQLDYNTDEFLNKINLHIQTLSDKKRENYIYDLKQIFDSSYLNESLNSKKEDKAKNLFLATQILNLNPSYKILKEISKTLDYAFEYNEEYEYISNYLIDNDIYTGATWNQNLHEDLQENGVNISYISLIEKIRELEFDQYYQKNGEEFDWLPEEELANRILQTILQVEQSLKGQNFLILDSRGQKNIQYLKNKGIDFNQLIDKFIKESKKYNLSDKMFYLNWVNKFLNNEYYKEQQINQKILDVLSKNQSFNMMFNLNIILKQHQYFLDKFAQEMVDEEVAGILKGSTFLQNLDEEMKKHGTKSYFVNNYKINSLLKTLNKNKWYWVDDDNYPIDEIDNNELISMILDYLEAS